MAAPCAACLCGDAGEAVRVCERGSQRAHADRRSRGVDGGRLTERQRRDAQVRARKTSAEKVVVMWQGSSNKRGRGRREAQAGGAAG